MKYLLISIFLLGCNPVKQVLRDKEKLDKIAEYVISSGYCVNDTIIQSKSDTLITYDTIYEKNDIKVVIDNARINQLEAKLALQTEKTEEYKAKANSRLKWLVLLLIAICVRILYKPIKKFILWHFSPMLK
jgi:hypothetical protein